MSRREPCIILDPAKVRAARLALGYPERLLSGALGVSNRVIDRIEEGADQSNLDLRFLRDLCGILGCTIHDLLVDPEAQVETSEEDENADVIHETDVETVGALLAADGGTLHVDMAARVLGWTRNRTLVALHRVEARLRPAGQRLAWLDDMSVTLAAGPTPEGVTAKVRRRDVSVYGITSDTAKLLHQLIATGTAARIGDWDPKQRQQLINAGLVELDHNHATSSVLPVELSDDLRYALGLDEM